MLLQELQEMGRSDSLEKLSRSTARAAEGLGFERFALLLVTPAKEPNRVTPREIFSNGQRFASLDNVPAEYLAAYQEIGSNYVDPVMRHARESTHPLVWGHAEYEHCGAMEQWEQQAPFGYAEGMVVAAHLPNGVHVVVGLESADPITTEPVALTRQLADFQLFAQFAVAPVIKLLQQRASEPEPSDAAETKLTARELECLVWASNAKTAWETGQILGISERTVAQHLANARRKLDCLTKLQAAMKAVQLGLLTQ